MHLIIGVTGNIGRHLVPLAVANAQRIRVVSRDQARADQLRGPGIECVVGNLRDRGVADAAFEGIRRVFVAINSDGEQEATELAVFEAAKRAKVEHLVKVSVIGPAADHVVHLARIHHRLEAALAATGIAHTLLRPSWFMDNFFGSAGTIAQGAIYGTAGEGRVGFVDARDIAAVADCVLRSPSAYARELIVTGPKMLTFAEAASAIGEGIGKVVSYTDLEESAFAHALGSAGLPPQVVDVVLQINRNAKRNGLAQETDTVLKLVGRAPRSLSAFAREHASRLT